MHMFVYIQQNVAALAVETEITFPQVEMASIIE